MARERRHQQTRSCLLALAALGAGAAMAPLGALALAQTPKASADPLLDILADLASAEAPRRSAGAHRAGGTHHPIFVAPLRALLDDPDPTVRAAGARALGEVGVPKSSEELRLMLNDLVRASDDPSANVRLEAIAALGRYPFPHLRWKLLALARDPKRQKTEQDAAAQGLAALSAEGRKRMEQWFNASAEEAKAAASSGSAVLSIEERLRVPEDSLARFAHDLLNPDAAQHGPALARIVAWPEPLETLPFLLRALEESQPALRVQALTALAPLPVIGARIALEAGLSDLDPGARIAAAEGVARVPDAGTAKALLGRLRVEPEGKVRQRLGTLLSSHDAADLLSALESLGPLDSALAGDILPVVAAIEGPRATTMLLNAYVHLEGGPTHTETSFTQTLGARPKGEVTQEILRVLPQTEPTSIPRTRLLRLLADERSPKVAAELLALCAEGRGDPQTLALLLDQPEEAIRPGLVGLLASQDEGPRALALEAAQRWQGPDVTQGLLAYLEVEPGNDRAFSLLLDQPEDARLQPLLALLANPRHLPRRGQILETLGKTQHPQLTQEASRAAKEDPALTTLAIDVLSAQEPKEAARALATLAKEANVAEAQRARAARLVAELHPEAAVGELRPLANDDSLEVKMAVRRTLHQLEPLTYPSWDPYGRIPLVALSGAFGASMLLNSAQIADAKLSPAFTSGVGLVLGGASAWLLTQSEELSIADAAYFGTVALWGTLGGWGLGGVTGLGERDTRWLTLAGEVLGLTAGAWTLGSAEWSPSDAVLANVASLEAAAAAYSLASLTLSKSARDAHVASYAALVAGSVTSLPMALLARRLTVRDDLALLFLAMGQGAWLGAWAAPLLTGSSLDEEHNLAAIVAGQGFGFLAGLALAQVMDVSTEQALYSGAGTLMGAGIGAGVALSFASIDPLRPRAALIEAGSLAGGLTLGLLAEHLDYDRNDPWILALSIAGGAFAGARVEVRAEEGIGEPQVLAGNMLLGASLGAAGGLLLTQLVDASDKALSYSLLGGATLAGAGAGFGRLAGANARTRGAITAGAVVAGLALTAPFAERLELGGPNLGLGAIYAASLGLWLGLLPGEWTRDGSEVPREQVAGGMILGSTLGAFGGVALSQALSLKADDLSFITSGVLAAHAIGAGLGLFAISEDRRGASALVQAVGAAGVVGATALAAADAWRAPGLLPHTLSLTLHGAWNGAVMPFIRHAGGPLEREIAGGALLGAGVGATSGLVLSHLLAEPLTSDELIEGSLYSLTAHALGLGAGLLLADAQAGAALMEGLGLGALGLGLALAPGTRFEPEDAASVLLGAGTLGWFGGWLPVALYGADGADARLGGGVLAGASLGILAGAARAQLTSAGDELEVGLFAAAGSAIGGGAGLAATGRADRTTAVLLEAAGVGTLAAGLWLAPHTAYDGGDLALLSAAAGLGALHSSLLPQLMKTDAVTPDAGGGAALVGGGVALLGAMGVAQLVDVRALDVLEASVLGEAAAIGAFGLALTWPKSDRRARLAAFELAGLGGMALAGYLAPRTEYTSQDYSLLGLTTAAGALHGALLPRMLGVKGEEANGGLLFGASVGLLTGAMITQWLELDLPDQAEVALFALGGHAIGAGLGLLGNHAGEGAQSALLSGFGLAGLAGGLAAAGLTEHHEGDRPLLAYGTAMGAWHGAWLGPALGLPSTADKVGGGALLGAGAGFLGASVAAAFTDIPVANQLESIATWAYGSAIGAGLALSLNHIGDRPSAALVEAGGLAGAFGGLLLASGERFSPAQLGLIGAGLTLGAWHGSTLPALYDPNAGFVERGGGALLGAGVLGFGAHILGRVADYSTSDLGEITLGAALGNLVGFGLGLMVPDGSRGLRLGLIDGFGLGATAAALALAPSFNIESQDVLDAGVMSAVLASMGGLLPVLWNGPDVGAVPSGQAAGGVLLGGGLGLGAALTLGPALSLDGIHRQGVALGATAGALAGGGAGLLLSKDDRLAVGLFEGLTLAGAVAVGATARHAEPSFANLALGTTWVGYLTWHAAGLTLLLDGTDRQALGATMASVGLGAATGMYLVPFLHLRLDQTLMLLAGSMWGTWIGGWSGAMLKDQADPVTGRRSTGLILLSSVLGSDVGIGLTSLVIGGLLDVEPARFAVINLCGLAGMMTGMLVAGFAQEEPLKAGNVLGSLGGLALGALVTSFFDFSAGPSPYETQEPEEKSPAASLASPLKIEDWFPSATMEPTPEGERFLVSISGRWH